MKTCRNCGRERTRESRSRSRCDCIPDGFWEFPAVISAVRDLDAAEVIRLLHAQKPQLTREALAEMTLVSSATISRILSGAPLTRMRPSRRALQELGAPQSNEVSAPDSGLADRVSHLLARPERVDAGAVDALASLLAAQRRLDDEVGAEATLPLGRAHAQTASVAADRARGPHAHTMRLVAAEWHQFDGWLHASTGRLDQAEVILRRSEGLAQELQDGPLVAQARNFLAYIARRRGDAVGITTGFLHAFHTPGAHPAQRVGDAIQAAHGYALLGEVDQAQRLLDQAAHMADQAAALPPPPTAYWLDANFHRLNLGLAHTGLGNEDVACDLLASGLAGLPVEQQGADWTREYRDALERLRC